MLTVLVDLRRPTSVGEITLASNDPFADPVIDPQYAALLFAIIHHLPTRKKKLIDNGLFYSYLETQHDVDCLVRGLKMIVKISKTEAMQQEIVGSSANITYDDDLDKLSDTELEDIVRNRVQTM